MTVRPQGSLTGGNNAYSINDAPDRNARLYNAVHSNTGNKTPNAPPAQPRRVPGAPTLKPKNTKAAVGNNHPTVTVQPTPTSSYVAKEPHAAARGYALATPINVKQQQPATRRVPGAPKVKAAPMQMNQRKAPSTSIIQSAMSTFRGKPTPAKRRVPGAPAPLRVANTGGFDFAARHAAAAAMSPKNAKSNSFANHLQERTKAKKANKFSVYSITESNMEEFKRKMDERDGVAQPEKPKGWQRLKKRVEWKSGVHCAVCLRTDNYVKGRLKPCGHRAMCNMCYEEIMEEGRGVNCPECFDEVKRLLPDAVPSDDDSGSDSSGSDDGFEHDRESSEEDWGAAQLDYDAAQDHLELNLAGKRLGRSPSTCGTGTIECGQNFGTGVGMSLVSFSYTNVFMAIMVMGSLPAVLAHIRGIRKNSRPDSPFAFMTIGNCGVSSCNVENKIFAIFFDTVMVCLYLVALIWERSKLFVYAHHIGDRITIIAEKCIMVSGLSANTSVREAKSHFGKFGQVERIEFINDLDGTSLALMYERRDAATNLRICEAKAEFGDTKAHCSGDCMSEQDWGEFRLPRHERRLRYIESNLEKLVEDLPRRKRAFVIYKNKSVRDNALLQLRKFGSGSWVGSMFSLSGFSMRGLGNRGVVHSKPGLYPSNILYHNVSVNDYQRYGYRFVALFTIFFVTFSTTAIYVAALREDCLGAAVLLYVSNSVLAVAIRKLVKRERRYLLSETNDATCKLTYLGLLFNALYMILYSSVYSSRDGGVARFERLFHQNWFDGGGGEIAQYYLSIDAIMEPLLILFVGFLRRCNRNSMVKHAVSQEQLNRAHNGIKLDACLEHSRANVAVTIAVVFSFGMPIALFAAWVGSCLKTLAVRHVLFFHARVPLWRDGASIYWDLSSLKIAVVFHFFITWAMCAGVDQTEKELNGTAPSVGAYIFPILGLLGSLALLVFASAIAPCVKRCLSRTTSIIAPIDEDNTRHNLDGSEDHGEEDEEGGSKRTGLDLDEDIKEMQKTANEAFDSDFVINPMLYVSFDPCDHPIFGAELRFRRSLKKTRAEERSREENENARKRAREERKERDRELLEKQRLRAEEAKNRLHAYVESMTRKKDQDAERMRKRAEAKKKRKGQKKAQRDRSKRLYDMNRSGSNFIV